MGQHNNVHAMHHDTGQVAVIGGGTSGVVCAKVLQQQGLEVQVFEKGSQLGGLWRFGNDNGMSSIYRSLHINTSKRLMQLSDYPMPEHMAEYPSHAEIIEYFEAYADHFNVRRCMRFNTDVRKVEKAVDGTWELTLVDGQGVQRCQRFANVVVANGHHWDARMVDFPGHFDGQQFHAHHYIDIRDPVNMAGKRVVVVGAGNSAMDIASELGQALRMDMSTPTAQRTGPAKVMLSQRSGVWIAPKVLGNIAQDSKLRHPMKPPGSMERFARKYVPRAWRAKVYDYFAERLIRSIVGDPERVGLKQPKERYSQRHGTISQDIHSRLIHGDVEARGNIVELLGHKVRFEDGSEEAVDVIVHCSGYRITFPFFDPGFISAPQNNIALWQRMVHPQHAGLFFAGLVQPKCSMMPIAELQASFMADVMLGKAVLPSSHAMQEQTQAMCAQVKAQFTRSESHTIQIDCEEYSHDLFQEWERCKLRQRKAA